MNRTQEEIVNRIESRKKNDMFGFEWQEYLSYLDYEHAKPYLKDGLTEQEWQEHLSTVAHPKTVMINYMPFAWEKANSCRGISAWRSLSHYQAWLWLDGDEELWPTLDDYQYYGKPQLVEICEYLGIDSSEWDDDVRVNSEDELEYD